MCNASGDALQYMDAWMRKGSNKKKEEEGVNIILQVARKTL
jgi:hypothetical protein